MDNLRRLIKAYEAWVAAHPDTIGDVETTTKWVSYFIAGRISDSNVVSELIYSLSNMLVLYNDRIIVKSRADDSQSAPAECSGVVYRLKVILSTLEYSEVFIEISAKRVFGNRGKWVFITLIQVLKAAGRFFILKNSTEQIITSPAMPSLNRRALSKQKKSGKQAALIENDQNVQPENSFSFRLKRSGRIIRKVEGAPPIQYRDFKIHNDTDAQRAANAIPKALLHAEYLYIAKPLLHLAAVGMFGNKRWKPYLVALAVDLASIKLYHKNRHLMTKQQRLEMSRRCVSLLLYLLRSPFYEGYTKSRLERFLDFAANNIPFVRMLAGPLKEYIPHWQDTYFYMWST